MTRLEFLEMLLEIVWLTEGRHVGTEAYGSVLIDRDSLILNIERMIRKETDK